MSALLSGKRLTTGKYKTFQELCPSIEIEGFNEISLDVQYPWEDAPRRYHLHPMHVNSFWMDKYPVTNAEFKKFMDATHYHPADDLDFLRDWGKGTDPPGWDNKPVIWVSTEDAEAYAACAGKLLAHEWEWQYAAQGSDGRLYPWGNEWDASVAPVRDQSRAMRGPDDVTAHHVAQFCGDSYYQPQGSIRYFPQAYKLDEHGKLLRMTASMDRSGAVGFRCVKEAQ